MRWWISVMVLASTALAGHAAGLQGPANVQRILLDTTLWGRDHPALLAQLRALRDAGETTAYVFPDRAAGASAFPTTTAVQSRVARVRAVAQPAALLPPFAAVQQAATARREPLAVSAAKTIDGDGYHVVLTRAPGAELLAPGMTLAAIRTRLGEPERVIQQTIQGIGDRKPVILTLHVYAGGAVAFAESNMSEPGTIERVVLNLTQVVPAVSR